ncbi:hypothetical protein [Paenibacillus sp. NPDC093718]|uniref:hypothetical protein n=1 Tax=Paenibacillus sp. NPDC093718 TaxID=3390601 RepID=UPI003D095243
MGTWYFEIDNNGTRTQQLFPVGAKVEGYIEAFFPQGTLINLLEPRAVGLTDTSALESCAPAEWMYPRYRIIAEVSGYDELNQWVLLANAELLGSQLDESERRILVQDQQ